MMNTPIYSLMIVCFLSSCASVPNQDLAELFDPIPLKGALTNALTSPDYEVGNWPSPNWWEIFHDPQLTGLIEQGMKENLTLKLAQARVDLSEQLAKKERALLFPHLTADYLETWQHLSKYGFDRDFFSSSKSTPLPNQVNQIDLTLNFSYELDFWGKNRHLFQAALGQARASQAELSQAILMVTTQIAQTYIQLHALFKQLSITEALLEDRNVLYDLSSHRQDIGISSVFPVLLSEKKIYTVEQLKFLIEQEILIAQNQLKVLTGQGPDAPDVQLPLNPSFERIFALPETLSLDLLSRRPDLQAQIWRVESAAKEIGAAKADFYPNVNLLAFTGLESLAFHNLFKTGSKLGGLSPAIHLPIFMGGQLRAQLQSKVAAFNEAVFAYNELLLQASTEVSDKLMLLQTQTHEVALQNKAILTVTDEYLLAQSLFKKGLYSYLTVLESQEKVLDEAFALTKIRRDYLLAVLQLIKALGGGYTQTTPGPPKTHAPEEHGS